MRRLLQINIPTFKKIIESIDTVHTNLRKCISLKIGIILKFIFKEMKTLTPEYQLSLYISNTKYKCCSQPLSLKNCQKYK